MNINERLIKLILWWHLMTCCNSDINNFFPLFIEKKNENNIYHLLMHINNNSAIGNKYIITCAVKLVWWWHYWQCVTAMSWRLRNSRVTSGRPGQCVEAGGGRKLLLRHSDTRPSAMTPSPMLPWPGTISWIITSPLKDQWPRH